MKTTAYTLPRRKVLNLTINRGMQLRMIGRISGILFVCLLLSSAVYYHFANEEISSSFQMFHIKAKSFLEMLWPVVIGSFCISLVAGIVASLFFPKSYAGSAYRIEQDLKDIMKGDLTKRISLRKGDENTALAAQLNALVASQRSLISDVREGLVRIESLSAPDAGTALNPEIHKSATDLLERLKQFRLDIHRS